MPGTGWARPWPACPKDEPADGFRHADLGPAADPASLAQLRKAYREHRKVVLRYRKADAEEASERPACPYAIVFSSGRWYLVARCDGVDGLRVFRVDRIEGVTLTDERYRVPASFEPGQVFRDGRAFVSEVETKVRIRFAPRVARWIAEREGGEVEADGSYVQELPLADLGLAGQVCVAVWGGGGGAGAGGGEGGGGGAVEGDGESPRRVTPGPSP